jgi:hypothetical protein
LDAVTRVIRIDGCLPDAANGLLPLAVEPSLGITPASHAAEAAVILGVTELAIKPFLVASSPRGVENDCAYDLAPVAMVLILDVSVKQEILILRVELLQPEAAYASSTAAKLLHDRLAWRRRREVWCRPQGVSLGPYRSSGLCEPSN